MSSELTTEAEAIAEAAITTAAGALGLPALLVPGLLDLFKTIAASADVSAAISRAKQNALADAEDVVAEEAALELNQHKP